MEAGRSDRWTVTDANQGPGMLTKINHKLDEIIAVLMDGRPKQHHGHQVEPNQEHAAQIAQVLRDVSTLRDGCRSADIRILQMLSDARDKLERLECMSQALLDAVAGIGGNVTALTTIMVDHDTATQATLAKLAALIAAGGTAVDPDVATTIADLQAMSASVATAAATIQGETAAMVAAV